MRHDDSKFDRQAALMALKAAQCAVFALAIAILAVVTYGN